MKNMVKTSTRLLLMILIFLLFSCATTQNKLAESEESYFKRGLAYHQMGQYDQAISDYNKALEIEPKAAEVYYRRANVYYLLKEYDKSWVDIKRTRFRLPSSL